MLEDRLLSWRLKHGSKDALARIYEKYLGYLLTLATALLGDVNSAEDVVHDFFVWFAQSTDRLRLDGSLKGFLATCVANRARDKIRQRRGQPVALDEAGGIAGALQQPEPSAPGPRQLQQLSVALAQLPHEQREVILLHIKAGMKFRQIAACQKVSINTAQSRYRYGLEKMRTLLNGEVST
jgi:RNA polymerase sigma-70 factor (ECF subfamily)